jgi:hypothetical protein
MHSVSTRKSGLRAVLDSNILARFLLTPRGFSGRLLGILETGGREKGSTSSSDCRFEAISISWLLGVWHTPKALRITAQGCRISGYPGRKGPDGSTLTGLRSAASRRFSHVRLR